MDNVSFEKDIDFFEGSKIQTAVQALNNASSVQSKDLGEIANIMSQFLKKINSTDNNYSELRTQYFESLAGKVFLQKLSIAFIYYFTEFLRVKYFKRKIYKTAEQANTDLGNFIKDITGEGAIGQCYKTYLTLLSGQDNLVPAKTFTGNVTMAHDLIRKILHTDICEKLMKGHDVPEEWGLTEVLDNISKIKPKNKRELTFDEYMKGLDNKDPVVRFVCALTASFNAAWMSGNDKFVIEDKLVKDKDPFLSSIYEEMDAAKRKLVKNVLENNALWRETLNFKTNEDAEKHFKSLHKAVNDIKETGSKKDKEDGTEQGKPGNGTGDQNLNQSVEHESEDPDKLNQLAMNMADYMTGRIDAQQFQNRDIEIRYGRPSPQPNEDGEMLLNELED